MEPSGMEKGASGDLRGPAGNWRVMKACAAGLMPPVINCMRLMRMNSRWASQPMKDEQRCCSPLDHRRLALCDNFYRSARRYETI